MPTPARITDIINTLEALSPDTENCAKQLQSLKSEFDLCWAALALHPDNDFDALGRLRSNFASRSIDKALQLAWTEELKAQRHTAIPLKGLFILGLGKLGGFDLNFSSDVDLIAYYDPDILGISANKGHKYILDKVLRRLTSILKPNHSHDFIWRVDWRLRPESSVSGLAMSTDEAQSFYFMRALPWHRLALMKARPIAGDIEAGETFLREITPFIWRQNLDFRALDELAHLKSRINLEHPALRLERAQPEPITHTLTGFNVKLGSGGIREIEFIANAQQLIWGGRQYELRTPNTLAALRALGKLGHISEADAQTLSDIYIHHRRLENAIQMVANEQTHIAPSDAEPQNIISALMGVSWDKLEAQTYAYRQEVSTAFKTLFEHAAQPVENELALPQNLNGNARSTAESWLNGFDRHGITGERLRQFQPLGRTLLTRVLGSSADDETALSRIDAFLKSLSRSEQYLHLLQRNPKLLDALITPLLYSGHMTRLLEQSPHIIDVFLNPQSAVNQTPDAGPDTGFIFADIDYETRLERLRRFVNEYLFQYYHLFMTSEKPTPNSLGLLHSRLTGLAETALGAAIQIVRDDLELTELPLAVLGLGKMGTAKMAPQSDLDLIFIFDDCVESDLAAKAVRRLRTALTTPLREGIAYELDMRLRPSGRSGPPAVKLASFKDHHMSRAKTWEHIALLDARIVSGDPKLGAKVMTITQEVFDRPRDQTQLIRDALHMHARLSEERFAQTPPDVWNTKLRRGGLMEADFLSRTHRLSDIALATDLNPVINEWENLQVWERLLDLTDKPFNATPQLYTEPLELKSMAAQNKKREAKVAKIRNALFKQHQGASHSDMQPIIWLD